MTEILQRAWAREPGISLTHIYCDLDSIDRVTKASSSFQAWLRTQTDASVTYLLVHAADLEVTLGKVGQHPMSTSDGPEKGKIFFTTYRSWALDHAQHQAAGCTTKQVFLLDMGFGVRTADMVLAMARLMHSVRHVLSQDDARSVHCVSMSSGWEPCSTLLRPSMIRTALDLEATPRIKGIKMLDHRNKVKKRERVMDTWLEDAAEVIREVLTKHERRGERTFALIASHEEAYGIAELVRRATSHQTSLFFIECWSNLVAIERAVHQQEYGDTAIHVKLVCIHDQVSVIPTIDNLQAIVVSPIIQEAAFDYSLSSMVRGPSTMLRGSYLGRSLRASAVLGAEGGRGCRLVYDWTWRVEDEDVLSIQYASSPAFKAELMTMLFGLVSFFPGMQPSSLPAELPGDKRALSEMARRLGVWRLIEPGRTPTTCTREFVCAPLGVSAARFAGMESNIHALVLLGTIEAQLPDCVKRVLIQMAMIISIGPSLVLEPSPGMSARERVECIRAASVRPDAALDHCHKGQLWLSLACLRVFQASGGLLSIARRDVTEELLLRTQQWSTRLGVTGTWDPLELCAEDVLEVELRLARAFPFNLIFVPNSQSGRDYFARDITSKAIVSERDDRDTVDWEKVTGAQVDGKGTFALYTHLVRMAPFDEDLTLRAVEVTVISNDAFGIGMRGMVSSHEDLHPYALPWIAS